MRSIRENRYLQDRSLAESRNFLRRSQPRKAEIENMAADNARPRMGLIPPVPIALALAILFFLPWVGLSCNPTGASRGQLLAASGQFPAEMLEERLIAHASGWDLAQGDLRLEEDVKGNCSDLGSQDDFPPSRLWAYFGLLLPMGVLLISAMGLTGRISPSGAGKVLLLLSLSGAGLMFAVTQVDYADDMLSQAEKQSGQSGSIRCSGYRQSMAQAKKEMGKILMTSPTGWTWGMLAAYGVVSACGVASLVMEGSTTPVSTPRRNASPFQNDVQKAISRTAHPYVARAREDELPDLGPDLFGPPAPVVQSEPEKTVRQGAT
jgi:hypothetical protein